MDQNGCQVGAEVVQHGRLPVCHEEVGRGLSTDHRPEGGGQGVDVTARLHAAGVVALLRGHEAPGAHHRAGAGLGANIRHFFETRDAEVGESALAIFGEQNVLRLDVAVHDAGFVGNMHGISNIGDQLAGLALRPGAVGLHLLPRCATRDEVHHDEDSAVGIDDVLNCNDMAMLDAGHRPCFGQKARTNGRAICQLRAEHLDGPVHGEVLVPRLVDGRHPPTPQDRLDGIPTIGELRRNCLQWIRAGGRGGGR